MLIYEDWQLSLGITLCLGVDRVFYIERDLILSGLLLVECTLQLNSIAAEMTPEASPIQKPKTCIGSEIKPKPRAQPMGRPINQKHKSAIKSGILVSLYPRSIPRHVD